MALGGESCEVSWSITNDKSRYPDFTINSLLAPPQFASVGARLLNLLHYGRSDALMVMFTLAFAVPLAVALLTALTAQLYPRRRAS